MTNYTIKTALKSWLRTDELPLDYWRATTGLLDTSTEKTVYRRMLFFSFFSALKKSVWFMCWIIRLPYQLLSFLMELETLHYSQLRKASKGRGCLIDRQTWLINGQNIKLGNFVKVSAFSSLMAGKVASITIGSNTIISTCVVIVAFNHGFALKNIPIRYQKWIDTPKGTITIGENVWIGANVTILPGTQIGDSSIIGAGSIVKGIVPADSIYVNKNDYQIKDKTPPKC